MADRPSAFEMRLSTLFDAYAAGAPVEVEAAQLASTIVRRDRHVLEILGQTFVKPRWLVPAAVTVLLLIALVAAVFIGSRLLETPPQPYRDLFTSGADIATARQVPLALELPDGRILIGGTQDGNTESATAEIYDPVTGLSHRVSGEAPLGTSVGVVDDNGRAFVVAFSMNMTSSRAYVFDPTSRAFRRVPIDAFENSPVYGVHPSVALLRDGRVLISGGQEDVYALPIREEAVLFDFESEEFIPTGPMGVPRRAHAMTTLHNGRVLVVGGMQTIGAGSIDGEIGPGNPLDSAEIYDPSTGLFSSAGTLPGLAGELVSALLDDGRVAIFQVARSQFDAPAPTGPFQVQIFDPNSHSFVDGGLTERGPHAATSLRDGRVLLTGTSFVPFTYAGPGEYHDRTEGWAAIYDPATSTTVEMPTPNAASFGVVALQDGRVLLLGGVAYPPLDANGNTTGESFPVPWVQIFE